MIALPNHQKRRYWIGHDGRMEKNPYVGLYWPKRQSEQRPISGSPVIYLTYRGFGWEEQKIVLEKKT